MARTDNARGHIASARILAKGHVADGAPAADGASFGLQLLRFSSAICGTTDTPVLAEVSKRVGVEVIRARDVDKLLLYSRRRGGRLPERWASYS
ncbi:MAG TPA: hypothetical protein VJX16_16830 [Terriglobales bacterium]|nr:hypothetical protein [Terriglobales bacterium]